MEFKEILPTLMITGTLNLNLADKIEINKIVTDVNNADENSIYIEIDEEDNVDSLKKAEEKGCRVAIVKSFKEDSSISQVRVTNPLSAMKKIEGLMNFNK